MLQNLFIDRAEKNRETEKNGETAHSPNHWQRYQNLPQKTSDRERHLRLPFGTRSTCATKNQNDAEDSSLLIERHFSRLRPDRISIHNIVVVFPELKRELSITSKHKPEDYPPCPPQDPRVLQNLEEFLVSFCIHAVITDPSHCCKTQAKRGPKMCDLE